MSKKDYKRLDAGKSDDVHIKTRNSISDYDRKCINELRSCVKDVLTPFYDTDFNLLRWIVGFNYNISISEEKLRQHLAFRKQMSFDVPIDELPFHPVKDYYRIRMWKASERDDNNLFISVQIEGNCDIAGLYYSMSVSDFLISQLCQSELAFRMITEAEAETGRQHKLFAVVDLEGTKIDKWTWYAVTGSFQTMISLRFENYVELIDRIVIINPGKILHAAYKLVEPLLPHRTKEKLKIYGSDWKSHLLSVADSTRLPLIYGGSIPSDLPDDIRDLSYGLQAIPIDLYYNHEKDRDLLAKTTSSRLSRYGHFIFPFHIVDTDSCLHWFIKSDGGYKFAIYYSEAQAEPKSRISSQKSDETGTCMEEVYPQIQWCGEFVPDIGQYKCEKTGWYYIEICNDSRFFSRNVEHYFRAESE